MALMGVGIIVLMTGRYQPTPNTYIAPTTTLALEAPIDEADVTMAAFELSVLPHIVPAGISMSLAVELAIGTCIELDTGRTLSSIYLETSAAALDGDWSNEMIEAVGYIIGAGINAFCPEHTWQLDNP